MYFDFGDGHPDLQRLPRALSTREEVLLAIIIHLLVIILVLVAPQPAMGKSVPGGGEGQAGRRRATAAQQRQQQQPFMFVQPRLDMPARRPPPQAPPSDIDRQAMTRFRPEKPTNRQPASRGNTAEFTEGAPPQPQMRAAGQPNQRGDDPAQTAPAKDPGQEAVRIPDMSDRGPAFARDGSTVSRPAQSGALGECAQESAEVRGSGRLRQSPWRQRRVRPIHSVRYEGCRVRPVGTAISRAVETHLAAADPECGDVPARTCAISFNVHKDGNDHRHHDRSARRKCEGSTTPPTTRWRP